MLFNKFMNDAFKFALLVFLTILFAACDKVPFLKNSTEGETENQGIVQTDWKSGGNTSSVSQPEKDNGNLLKQPIILADESNKKPEKETTGAAIKKSEGNSGEFAVQIGAFLVADNATRLIAKLEKKGYHPSLTVVTTPAKKWNMVRIGSFPDKKSAENAARKFTSTEKMETAVVKDRRFIKLQTKADLDQSSKKVAEEDDRHLPITVSKFEPERFSFQIGGLRTKANAEEYKLLLLRKGYKPYVKTVKNAQSNEVWYSVRIGIFNSIDTAAENAAAFTAKEAIPATAVSVDK